MGREAVTRRLTGNWRWFSARQDSLSGGSELSVSVGRFSFDFRQLIAEKRALSTDVSVR
jgi:hypothetical protein